MRYEPINAELFKQNRKNFRKEMKKKFPGRICIQRPCYT